MRIIFSFLVLSFSVSSFAQTKISYAAIDSRVANDLSNSTTGIAKFVTSNFKTETEKIRAVFYWTASNISYDVANMFAVNFNDTEQEKIENTLKTKKGICIHYATVFNDIAKKIGVESYIVEGYTKQNGKVGDLAHAWVAAKIDGQWFLFDPTWGAGYVNKGKFYKKINDAYFKVAPAKMVASHIPFDYLWQFLNYPITNAEFYEGKIQMNKAKKYFDFDKEIIRYTGLSEIDKLFETTERIEKNGIKNAMILERYEGKKKHLAYLRQNTNIEKLNLIVNEMNEAVVLLNDFINYRNKKFKPTFPDEQINNMIQIPREKLTKCQNDIYSIGSVGTENASNVTSIKKAIAAALAQAEEHASFVKDYLGKSKIVRKTMFSKVSWFGIPLN